MFPTITGENQLWKPEVHFIKFEYWGKHILVTGIENKFQVDSNE